MIFSLLGMATAYLFGSLPTGYIIGRLKGVDVRSAGSGNVGATNVLRTVGTMPAIIALVIDIAKGVVAVTLFASFFYQNDMLLSPNVFKVLLGLSAITGHNKSVFLRFKGGKGVATSCGVMAVLLPKAMAVALVVFVITVWVTRYVSLASIMLSLTVPITAALLGEEVVFVILAVTLCVVISYMHKENIKRLIKGTEHKIGKK